MLGAEGGGSQRAAEGVLPSCPHTERNRALEKRTNQETNKCQPLAGSDQCSCPCHLCLPTWQANNKQRPPNEGVLFSCQFHTRISATFRLNESPPKNKCNRSLYIWGVGGVYICDKGVLTAGWLRNIRSEALSVTSCILPLLLSKFRTERGHLPCLLLQC